MNSPKFDSRDFADPRVEETIEAAKEAKEELRRIANRQRTDEMLKAYRTGKISRDAYRKAMSIPVDQISKW